MHLQLLLLCIVRSLYVILGKKGKVMLIALLLFLAPEVVSTPTPAVDVRVNTAAVSVNVSIRKHCARRHCARRNCCRR